MMVRSSVAEATATAGGDIRLRATDVTRLEAFSDAVFAFALALLVVSSNVPTTAAELFATLRDFPVIGTLMWWHWRRVHRKRDALVASTVAAPD